MAEDGIHIEVSGEVSANKPKVEKPEDIIQITEQDLAGSDQKPTDQIISITEQDLQQTKDVPSDIVIHYRDVARNPLQWISGASKDAATFVRDLKKDSRWWGGSEMGKRKNSEYQKIEKERFDVESLFNQIVILPEGAPQTWRDLTEKDLGEIEIRLIHDALEPSQGEDIVITEEDVTSPQPLETPAEQERRNRGYWERYIQEQRELFDTQARAIDAVYQRQQFRTPIQMDRHHRQEHMGQQGIWSCVVASTLNALYALQEASPSDNETSIINAIGGRSAFTENGYLPMSRAYDYIRDRGLLVRDSGNIMELMQTLENGGVGLIVYGGHARLISGAETRDNQVMLRINDPLQTEVSLTPVRGMMERINQTRNFYNMFLIEKMPNVEIQE